MAITIQVPGSTSNLAHGFDCMGMAVALTNRIIVTPRADGTVSCPEAADAGLQRMAERVRGACTAAWDVELPGFDVRIDGAVPMSRGLGSSSTIYLGLGAACQVLADHAIDRDELISLGVGWEGHPDNVTASALGGFTLAGRDRDGLIYQRYPVPDGLQAVIAIPDHEVRTADARGALPAEIPVADAVSGWQRSALIAAAFAIGDLDRLHGLLEEGWHERYRAPLNPGFTEARKAAAGAGAIGTIISGSGSTVLAFVTADTSAAVATAMRGAYTDISATVLEIGFDATGLQQV